MNESLLRVIRTVRRRWRLRLVLRGLAVLASAGLVVFLVSAYGMDRFRFTTAAVTFFRVVAWGALLGLGYRYVWQPLRRRVTDEQVALYLEEHEPSLDGQVMSAAGFGSAAGQEVSRALVEEVVERAVQRCHAIDDGRRVEHTGLVRSTGWLAGAMVAGFGVLLLNPAFVRNSGPFLLSPFSAAAPDNPYAITVTPGDSLVARGADLRVSASLVNFDADDVEIVMRPLRATEWERWPMTIDDETPVYLVLLFDVSDTTEYFVEAGGVRSPVYRIDVADLPYVERIALEYHYPRYTGLSVHREEDGGDIAALVGTNVRIQVTPTMPVVSGALVVDADTLPLSAGDDGTLGGAIAVRANGSYRVLMAAPDGRLVTASPEYFIDALEDMPPIVSFSKPGRDASVSSIDEMFIEARAEDDFGVRQVDLIYAVNGGPEDTVALFGPGGARKQVTAAHTLYLEEFDLEPGDVVAYYARASDAGRSGAAAVTDIYFISIRPFDHNWTQAEQAGGQGGGEGADVGELSRRQRDIVAATFNLLRDREEYSEDDFRDNMATLTLAQGRLREDVVTLVRRIESRGVVQQDSSFASIATELPQAAEAMQIAEERLGERQPREALPPEQQALQHLQRAESAYRDRQLAQGNQGGGGGGQQGDISEELSELFELELDRMRNQYEQVERGERRETDQQVDEMLEKLRELARRQQQANERARAQAQRGNPSGGTGQGQRRLADETEELARRLERLSRERGREQLAETARRLEEAANAMRRAASQGASEDALGNRALDRLRDARRQLEQGRSAGLERDVQDALERARRLAEQQAGIQRDLARVSDQPDSARQQIQRMVDRKEAMAREVDDLEGELERLSRDARQQDQPDAAERLRGAAAEMRDTRLRDKIRYSEGVIQQRNREYARNFEESIGADLENLRQQLEEAAGAIGESREQRLGRALDETRDLAQALESMRERMEGQEGQRGQTGQDGQEGQAQQDGQRGGGGAQGGRLDPEAQRQFQRELRERVGELRELRGQFERDGVDVSQLDQVLRAMGRWDNTGPAGDPRGLEALETQILQGLKEFEFALRRELLGGDSERASLAGSEEVPAEYRQMVEEYYRRLAERRR